MSDADPEVAVDGPKGRLPTVTGPGRLCGGGRAGISIGLEC